MRSARIKRVASIVKRFEFEDVLVDPFTGNKLDSIVPSYV